VKKGRKLKGWTQERAAFMAGMKRATWGSYEDSRAFPSADNLSKIADALSVDDDLYNFINCDDFYTATGRRRKYNRKNKVSPIEKKYNSLPAPIRHTIDTLLGLC
jgi:transcriptional regulator with XRE-family HTH domain